MISQDSVPAWYLMPVADYEENLLKESMSMNDIVKSIYDACEFITKICRKLRLYHLNMIISDVLNVLYVQSIKNYGHKPALFPSVLRSSPLKYDEPLPSPRHCTHFGLCGEQG